MEKENLKDIKDTKDIKEKDLKNFTRNVKFEKVDKEFDQKLIEVTRVTRVTEGGKRLRFRACVVAGNRNGKVGVGIAKSGDVSIAVDKAFAQAKKNIIDVSFSSYTIPCEVTEKYKAAKVMLKPATEGTNIVAGGATRSILELAGVKNAVAKTVGTTKNKIANVYATLNALKKLKEFEEIKIAKFKKIEKASK
ncbi:MAG: 30S ribosomal protein S5 [Patescibacteria group bacterium]